MRRWVERWRLGAEMRRWTSTGIILGLAPMLSLSCPGAEAQISGSIHVGQSRSTSTFENGRFESRQQSESINARFGRGAGTHIGTGGRLDGVVVQQTAGRSPFGRLNFGRSGTGFVPLPDTFGPVLPHSHLSSGLIEQNFAIMRNTSPFPNQFAGGIFNPRPFVRRSGFGSFFSCPFFGDFCYGGYAFGYGSGYGSGFYGGYVPSVYSAYGAWYPQYLPLERVYIIERERVRDYDDEDRAPRARAQEEDGDRPERSRTSDGEYYLSPAPRSERGEKAAPAGGESLEDAAASIKAAWMNGDHERLLNRIGDKGKVRVYLKGKYKYSVDAADFGQMSRDAMSRIDTVSFTLDRIQRRGDDHAFVSGKHVYRDPERQKHEVYVSYGLVKEGGRWKIVEAGSSTEPVSTHSD